MSQNFSRVFSQNVACFNKVCPITKLRFYYSLMLILSIVHSEKYDIILIVQNDFRLGVTKNGVPVLFARGALLI